MLTARHTSLILTTLTVYLTAAASFALDVDCNANGVPDRCDLACGEPGTQCDIPGCGQSEDCNQDTRPDECTDSHFIAIDSSNMFDVDKNTGIMTRRSGNGITGFRPSSGLTFVPSEGVHYAADKKFNDLITINPTTGTVKRIGNLQGRDVHGLAYDPVEDTLFAIVDARILARIDRETAQVTTIGETGYEKVLSLAFDTTDRILYAYEFSYRQLLTINTQSGLATPIGEPFSGYSIDSLTYDAVDDILYGTTSAFLGTFETLILKIDKTNGSASLFLDVSNTHIRALSFDSHRHTICSNDAGFLREIDPETGLNTQSVITSHMTISSVAFDNTRDTLLGASADAGHLVEIDTGTNSSEFLGMIETGETRAVVHDPILDRIYAVDWHTDELIVVDPEDGPETIIGDLGENLRITSMAMNTAENKIYATDGIRLMLIDPQNASISILGDVEHAGEIGGIAFDNSSGTLYAVDNDNSSLATIDVSSVSMTQVHAIETGHDIWDLTFQETSGLLYAVNSRIRLVVIDPARGTAQLLGMPAFSSYGMTYDHRTKVAYISDGRRLASIDPVSQMFSYGPHLNSDVYVLEIALDPATGILYGTDWHDLLIVNPETGSVQEVGSFGDDVGVLGLAFSPDGHSLYGTTGVSLLEIDKTSGAATLVGPFGIGTVVGLTFDETTHSLYGLRYGRNELLTIDIESGLAEPVGNANYQALVRGMISIPAPSDCNKNNMFDACDIAEGVSLDFNDDGVPNECDFFSDCDLDNLVTLTDHACLADCITGPSMPTAVDCARFDFDNDDDIDLIDWGRFQAVFGTQ